MTRPVPDQGVRDEALDPLKNYILEAPAGSGKTDLLISRYLNLLSRVNHPRQILAVTFTRKAAAEMVTRITQVLTSAQAGGAVPPEDPWELKLRSLGRRALEKYRENPAILLNPDSLQVGTFHSFCSSVVRAWPLEAQIQPGLELLEDIEQEVMLDEAVDQYVGDLLSGKGSDEEVEAYKRRLASMNNNPDALSRQLRDLLKKRDGLIDFLGLFPFGGRKDSFGKEMERRLGDLAGLFLSPLRDSFREFKEDWRLLKKNLGDQKEALGENFPDVVPGKGLGDIKKWKDVSEVFLTKSGTPRKQFSSQYGFPRDFVRSPSSEFVRNLPPPIAQVLASLAKWPDPEEDNIGIAALGDLLFLIIGTLKRLEDLIHSRGMDYLELELATIRALGQTDRPSEGLIFFHEHLRHILVDEAQDLNHVQVDILGKLTEGWEPGDGRTAFMVGDPKQSIYRFRRAEVSLFYKLKNEGLSRKGESSFRLKPLLLSSNFRSSPDLVTFANHLFKEVMTSPRREYDEVEFSPSQSVRDKPDRALPIRTAIFYDQDDSRARALSPLEREAKWVGCEIARLHSEAPRETIAILIPARTHLFAYVKALRDLQIPLRLMEGEPLDERSEVCHLLNLFRALVRPFDDLAWAGALRAPWLRATHQALLDLSALTGAWSQRVLSKKIDCPKVRKFSRAVLEANKMFGRENYGSTLLRLWEDLDGPRQTAHRYGTAGVSNARAFLELVGLCSGLPGEEALVRLRRLLENAYTPPDPEGAFSDVQMMTIHRAKGLEFDHVFVVNLNYDPLHGGRGQEPAYRMSRLHGEGRHFLVASATDHRTGKENLACYLLKAVDRQQTLAEARRLFYVAATRARESLTLTGVGRLPISPQEPRSFKTPLSSLLNGVVSRVEQPSYFRLLENPEPQIPSETESQAFSLGLLLPPFMAEPLPYLIQSPSKVEDETSLAVAPGAEEEGDDARARGLVIHRILETLALRQDCPGAEAVALALAAEGMPIDGARAMAPEILEESFRAWEDPDFRALREFAEEIHPEWGLEDFDQERTVRVGRFDLLLKGREKRVVLDYKTSRPEKGLFPEGLDEWVEKQVRHDRPQLSAYAEMAARALHLPNESIAWAVLFTALPRLVWGEPSNSSQQLPGSKQI